MNQKTCCCGCSLKTGCKIIGALQIVGGIISIAVFGGLFWWYSLLFRGLDYVDSLCQDEDYAVENQSQCHNAAQSRRTLTGVWWLMIVCVIFLPISIINGSILIHGVRKEKPGLLKLWMYLTIFILVVGVVLNIIIIAMTFSNIASLGTGTGLSVALTAYFIYVVKELRQQMIEGDVGKETQFQKF